MEGQRGGDSRLGAIAVSWPRVRGLGFRVPLLFVGSNHSREGSACVAADDSLSACGAAPCPPLPRVHLPTSAIARILTGRFGVLVGVMPSEEFGYVARKWKWNGCG